MPRIVPKVVYTYAGIDYPTFEKAVDASEFDLFNLLCELNAKSAPMFQMDKSAMIRFTEEALKAREQLRDLLDIPRKLSDIREKGDECFCNGDD